MTTGIYHNLTSIHDSETQYRLNLHKTELIYRDEEARLLQLHNLKLRDEAANLGDKLSLRDERIETLLQQATNLRAQLGTQADSSRSKDGQLSKQALDLAALGAEIDSLNAALKDANTLVQEKHALARELDRLRPELDHLKSQSADYQQFSAEKYDLQRRLEMMESKLKNEKSRNQLDHNTVVDARIDELRSKLEGAERQAVADRGQREKIQSKCEHILSQSRSDTTRLEGEVQQLKLNLKEAQSELKATQAELKTCQINLKRAQVISRQLQEQRKDQIIIHSPKSKTMTSKKMAGAIAVKTPSRDESIKRPIKRRATEQALLGGKSEFSITPFLNRAKSLIDESDDDLSRIEDHEPSPSRDERPLPAQLSREVLKPSKGGIVLDHEGSTAVEKGSKPRGRLGAMPVANLPSLAKKSSGSSKKGPIARNPHSLAKVLEEEEQKSDDEISAPQVPDPSQATKKPSLTTNIKKKRKLLGGANQSIFNDDEGEETVAQRTKVPLGPPRRLKAPLKGAVSAFSATGAFSPLKRDRRGANASFLA